MKMGGLIPHYPQEFKPKMQKRPEWLASGRNSSFKVI